MKLFSIGLLLNRVTTTIAVVLVAGVVGVTLSPSMKVAPVSAASERTGELHVTKDCSAATGLAGTFCTITSSNLAAIKTGSKVFYDQADGIPSCSNTSPPCPASGMLDSNVVLYVGTGDWAVGRCTVDDSTNITNIGLCTFSDGTGQLAGFTARVNVSFLGGTLFGWDGKYKFNRLDR